MLRTTFITSLATAAIIGAAPAAAGPGGGHGGGGAPGGGAGASAGAMGGMPGGLGSAGGLGGGLGAGGGLSGSINANAPLSSSGVHGGAGATGGLSGNAGINAGAGLGAISNPNGQGQNANSQGNVSTRGRGNLNVNGNALTRVNGSANVNATNVRSQGAAHASINGLVHASPKSALARAGVTSLTGLATGLGVNNSAGARIGTVSNIITNRAGAVVAVQVSLNGGGTVTLPASSLRMNGSTVVAGNVGARIAGRTPFQGNDTQGVRSSLTGLTAGTPLVRNGVTIGTVTAINTSANGLTRSVQVTLSNGRVINLDAHDLRLSGGVLTAVRSSREVGEDGNSQGRASLGARGVTNLTGLTTGLSVNNSLGTRIGAVSGILTNRAGAVVGVRVALKGGGTVTLPATSLRLNGTTLVTSSRRFG